MSNGRRRHYLPPVPFVRTSDTSVQAAEEAAEAAPTQRQRVLDELAAYSEGLTDEELQMALPMNPSTERPRRIELVRMGLVADSGRTRRTMAGRQATVWVAVEGK
jgi:hypothetical protein